MKKINYLVFSAIAVLAIAVASCSKSDNAVVAPPAGGGTTTDPLAPSTTQYALLAEGTGVWCGYCPVNGTEMMKQMTVKYPNVIGIAMHTTAGTTGSDKFYDNYSINGTFLSNFSSGGVPNFYVNNTNSGQSPESDIIDALAATAKAGVKHTSTNDGTKWTINVRAKFFADTTGTFYLSSYAIQNHIAAKKKKSLDQHDYVGILQTLYTGDTTTTWKSDQASDGNGGFYFKKDDKYYHEHILTTQPDGITSKWGQKLDSTNFKKDYQIDYTFTITSSSTWYNTSDVEIISILWKKVGSKYNFINGYKD